MGNILKRPGSPYFYARFTVDGKEYWISTKKKNRAEAKLVAEAKEKMARGESSIDDHFSGLQILLAALPQDQQDAKRQELSRRLLRNQSNVLPLAEAWQAWLGSSQKRNPGAVTIRGYDAIWKRFTGWINKLKIEFLHEVTPLHAEDYAADVWRSHVSPATFNAHVKFLRAMFNVLKHKAGLVLNPWVDINTLDLETQGRENFTPEELKTICSKAQGSFRYMIGIGLYTGMRLGDVVNLKWTNIGKDRIVLVPSKTKRKGKKIEMSIHPVLRALLNELRKQSGEGEYLFPEEKEIYQKDGGNITRRFQQFLNDCEIKTTEQGGEHRRKAIVRKGFHSLRHSFVSLCASNLVPQSTIQELVGHGSPAMTALYSHADFEQKQDAINGLPAMVFEKQGKDITCRPKLN